MSAPLINEEAERVLLGKILADDRRYYDIADRLRPEDFGTKNNQEIYRGMQALSAKGTPIMRASMQSQLISVQAIDGLEVPVYLAAIVSDACKAEYSQPVEHFARIVEHNSARRKLIEAAREIKDRAASATLDVPVEELHGFANAVISKMDAVGEEDSIPFLELMTKVLQQASINKSGVETGMHPFDHLVGPMRPGQLIVIGGETASGKTALVLQLAYMIATRGTPVEVFELEMSAEEVGQRWESLISGVPVNRISSPKELEFDDHERMASASFKIGRLPLYVDEHAAVPVSLIQSRLARAIRKRDVKIAIVDHLQYVRPNNDRANENVQIRQVVDDIKAMAKRLQIPIMLVSHVHRQAERVPAETADQIKRPDLRDLYGSSAIEKAADVVVFVHRPYYFLQRCNPRADNKSQHECDLIRWQGRAEFVLCKNRQRKGYGVMECDFNEELTAFNLGT